MGCEVAMKDTTLRKELGRKLQEARKNHGYKSAKEFAQKCGLAVSAYTEYEQGRRGISFDDAVLFADTLGITLDEMSGREAPSAAPAPTTDTPPDERQLLNCYRSMNNDGKSALLASAVGLMPLFPEIQSADRRTA